LVAVLLQVTVELHRLEQAVTFRRNLVDRNILGPAKMRIDTLEVLGGKRDFHACYSLSCLSMSRDRRVIRMSVVFRQRPTVGRPLVRMRQINVSDLEKKLARAAVADSDS